MNDMPNNEAIIREIAVLSTEGKRRDEKLGEIRGELNSMHSDISEMKGRLSAGDVHIANIDSTLTDIKSMIGTASVAGQQARELHEARIRLLEQSEEARKTKDGFIKSAINSRPAGWIAAMAAAVGAWFMGSSQGGGS